jgi:hypothetical protein
MLKCTTGWLNGCVNADFASTSKLSLHHPIFLYPLYSQKITEQEGRNQSELELGVVDSLTGRRRHRKDGEEAENFAYIC